MTLIYLIKHLLSLFTLTFLLSLMPSSLQADEFDEISHTLCDQINGGLGALPKLPGTISTHRREGDIEQTLTIENHSHFLIRIKFHSVDQSGKVSEATIERRFFFKDFSLGGRYRFEVNHKILTLSLQDTQGTWPLGFRSSTELTKAVSLFTKLITLSEQAPKEELLLSSLAKNAGYKSLVISPRKSTIKESIHTLATGSDKDSMVAWLTVNTADEEKNLLEEAENCLPFFVYNIDTLDCCSFYTVSSPQEHEFQWYGTDLGQIQSVLSEDTATLKTLLETKSQKKLPCYIHFTKTPPCQSPSAIFHHPGETYVLPKLLKAEGISFSSTTLHEIEPLFWESRIPSGTISYWFMPLNIHSDDIFRYLFEKENASSITYLLQALIKEYPNLKPLLQQKSFFFQQETVQESIVKGLGLFHESHISLPQKAIRVLKIALMCHEIGYAFGTKEERLYNSYPFALIVAEKLGCSEEEQNMLELLFFDSSSQKTNESSHKDVPFGILFKEAFLARSHAISPESWIPLKAAYQEVLSSFQTKTTTSKEIKHFSSFSKQTLSALCFGLTPLQGSLPTRRLFSSYIWEERDALHRDGIHLKRLREKYEQQILHNPLSPWKSKFWQWVDSKLVEKPLSPTLYLKNEQKQSYCPIIFEGKLYTHEGAPICSQEIIFVIDGQKRLYVGAKKDGNGPEDLSFNHASFTAAAPVATAGKIILDAEGYPIILRNASGHYRPKIQETTLALLTLKESGIDIGRLQVEYSSDSIDKLPTMEGTRFLSLFQNSLKNSNAY